jgi:hypothetical protein
MRRVGAIYCTDLSASKDRDRPSPLREISRNHRGRDNGGQPWQKSVRTDYNSEEESMSKAGSPQYHGKYIESDRIEYSFNDSRHSSYTANLQYSNMSEPQVVKKLTHLNAILK